MIEQARVYLHAGRDRSVLRRHPWIFSGAIERIDGNPLEGDRVTVVTSQGKVVASGHFGEGSIAVKVFDWSSSPADQNVFEKLVFGAVRRRISWGLFERPDLLTAFRIINAEGDDMPGLVVDRYGEVLVCQFHSLGMWNAREVLIQALLKEMPVPIVAVYNRSASTLKAKALHAGEIKDGFLFGEREPVVDIFESGLRYQVNVAEGQKTGFYLDQRDNRSVLTTFAGGKRVLNCFSYTGGFSMAALQGGARSVLSVDASQAALKQAEAHVQQTGFNGNHATVTADCLDFLQKLEQEFDLIVLDPPAFVKHRKALQGALRGYETINALAFKQVARNGVVFTFSCSQLVTAEVFREMIEKSAVRAGRRVQILRELSQASCHPVQLFHPEGRYLKGFVLGVD